jgi:4a-hydroxytetrahydrobiopterin dehydratase
MANIEQLTDAEVVRRLDAHAGWTLAGGKLRREFHFSNFVEAFGFMTKVAILAECADHHPEWSNVYSRVTIELTTHDAGGISERDFALAAQIDSLLQEGQP